MNTVKVLTLESELIPQKLKKIPNAPQALYYRGELLDGIGNSPIVAIVGSRKVDEYGKYVTQKFASELAQKGIVIISGLALGVDALAHSAALAMNGTTLAVLPSGIESVYPRTNEHLACKIEKSGGLLSEYSGRHTPRAYNFLERNRLISGLADIVIVTQAAAKSGSLNTAAHAKKQGKIVMAVPGPITNPLCEGTNGLIKSGATPLLSSDQIFKSLKIDDAKRKINKNYTALEQTIINLIKVGVADSDSIIVRSGQSTELVITTLTMLELKGDVTKNGNRWVLMW
jgi:DNA processing protein